MILLDTHTLLWTVSDSRRLSARAADVITAEMELGVAAISLWEISMLVTR